MFSLGFSIHLNLPLNGKKKAQEPASFLQVAAFMWSTFNNVPFRHHSHLLCFHENESASTVSFYNYFVIQFASVSGRVILSFLPLFLFFLMEFFFTLYSDQFPLPQLFPAPPYFPTHPTSFSFFPFKEQANKS